MNPYYSDNVLTLYQGDALAILATLPSESVDCVVTSPPYWGLRDYGTATWLGGEEAHKHRIGRVMGNANKGAVRDVLDGDRSACMCGATRQDAQLGLEATPEEYVANLVAVFREVKRVLKATGTLWLNLGDSYSGSGRGLNGDGTPSDRGDAKQGTNRGTTVGTFGDVASGLKPKDLVGIPWRVAFALQADGWYLRSDVIWAKPNPMPESVTDRPTKAHEYLFLLSKSPRYYYDADAVREPVAASTVSRLAQDVASQVRSIRQPGKTNGPMKAVGTATMRNLRSVWNIATRPYKGAHFAVFPPELPERCIKAGSSERGVCPQCGKPWERIFERTTEERDDFKGSTFDGGKTGARDGGDRTAPGPRFVSIATGWRPTCAHPLKPVPAIVLDPFAGSGTVGLVANRLSRRAILIDLNPEYLLLQMERNIKARTEAKANRKKGVDTPVEED